MSPFNRTLALTAVALAIPAAIAAAAGPERMRRLPGQVRELWHDDTVEGQLKRLSARLEDLTDDLSIHGARNDSLADLGRVAAIAGAVLLVPVALAAWFGPERIRQTARQYRDDWARDERTRAASDVEDAEFASDLDDLEADIAEQREDAFESVTGKARNLRD